MFGHQRKARVLLAFPDILLVRLAFGIANRIRVPMHWPFLSYLTTWPL